MRAVIFDIDGTLADVAHRRPHLPNWKKFFDAMVDDPVIEPVAFLARQIFLGQEAKVLIVSARPADYLRQTAVWLQENHIAHDRLYMRKSGDYREDSIVKAEILQQILDDGYEPFLVVDDRPQVVKMWRDFGLITAQVAPDELLDRHDGKQLLDIMVGPSGSGKSTYVAKHYKPHQVISTDKIREELFGAQDAPEAFSEDGLKRTWNLAYALLRARLEVGEFTVFDATNVTQKERKKLLSYVPRGQFVRYIVIDREFDEKLRDKDWRRESVIVKQHKRFVKEIPSILLGDSQPNVVVLDKRQHKV